MHVVFHLPLCQKCTNITPLFHCWPPLYIGRDKVYPSMLILRELSLYNTNFCRPSMHFDIPHLVPTSQRTVSSMRQMQTSFLESVLSLFYPITAVSLLISAVSIFKFCLTLHARSFGSQPECNTSMKFLVLGWFAPILWNLWKNMHHITL